MYIPELMHKPNPEVKVSTDTILAHASKQAQNTYATMSQSSGIQKLVDDATALYRASYGDASPTMTACAPGRVNLIGEHTDYTGGFVLPLAIHYSTVVVGSGRLVAATSTAGSKISLVSMLSPGVVEVREITKATPPPASRASHWTLYVVGVVAQYLADLPDDTAFDLQLSIAGDVPLGGGLSSSASLEVAVARFLEHVMGDHAFSTSPDVPPAKERAIRCQRAENLWCHSPCGIMDQYISSAGQEAALLLIDCTTNNFTVVTMKTPNALSLVVTNSHVKHDIAGGEYPVRVAQCKAATEILRAVHGDAIATLRNATLEQVEAAKDQLGDLHYRRAKHVVTENERTVQAKDALEQGDWALLGSLMNASHDSMRDDYETSCTEIDFLCATAQAHEGVYGSRLTGGGFGGCTVTLVETSQVESLMACLMKEYKEKLDKDCDCFETSPGPGARML